MNGDIKLHQFVHLIINYNLGNVAVAWRLPENISENVRRLQAYKLIMKYLTNTQVKKTRLTFYLYFLSALHWQRFEARF